MMSRAPDTSVISDIIELVRVNSMSPACLTFIFSLFTIEVSVIILEIF